jgi:ABC-2 type transport system ATP-binding protein
VRLDGVGKRYGFRQPWVVRDVSLDIEPGRLVRFEGKNGTGKSTLLRVIAGVSVPSKGTVTGRPITGYVPERFPPALPFTARDYLAHIGRIQGLAGDPLHARVDACLDQLGGLEFAGVPLRNMSKGMCQKVAVAQALLPSSGLLVLDEAWTGLDVDAKAALDGAVAQQLADGGSVVYVDHDPARLAHLDAERWRIEHGEAVQLATGAGAAPGPAGDGQAGPTVEIEVIGCPDGVIGQLPDLLSVRRDGDRAFVAVPASASDPTLRRLLAAGDGVHIRRVDYRAEYGIDRDGGPR